jgi:hypothetical protein
MSETFAVETGSRPDAVALLDALFLYNAWTIQLGLDRWLVVGRADTATETLSAVAAVDAWAEERGLPEGATLLGDDVPVVARGSSGPIQ